MPSSARKKKTPRRTARRSSSSWRRTRAIWRRSTRWWRVFFFTCNADHRDLHSFPTRRSSDLYQNLHADHSGDWMERFKSRPSAYTPRDRKSTRLNSSHVKISYAVFCVKKKKKTYINISFISKKKKNIIY